MNIREKMQNMKRKVFDKKGIVSEALPWIIISLVVLAILMTTIFILKGEGISVIESLKNLLKF